MTSRLPVLGLATLSILACSYIACGGDEDAAVTPGPDASTTSSSSSSSSSSGGSTSSSSSGGADASDDGAVTGTTITGKLVYNLSSVANVKVIIGDQVTTTAANGSFTIKATSMPYTLHVIVPKDLNVLAPKDGVTALTFVGLTTTSPILNAYAKVTPSTAVVKGTISGGSTTGAYEWRILVSGPQAGQTSGQTGGTSNASPKEYDAVTRWPAGQSQQTLSLSALEYKIPAGLPPGQGIPTEYISTATGFTTVPASGTADNQIGTFKPAETKLFDNEVDYPAGWTIQYWTLVLLGAQGGEVQFSEDSTTSSRLTNLPKGFANIPKARIRVQAHTANLGEYSVSNRVVTIATETSVQHDIRASPIPEKPAAAATGVKAGDTLSWSSAGDDCLYTASLSSTTDASTYFSLQTTATSATIPDLSAYGAGLTASAPYQWYVTCKELDVPKGTKASIDTDAVLGGQADMGFAVSRYMKFVTK